MNPVVPGSSIYVPIDLDSGENSFASSEGSNVTFQTEGSGTYEFEVNQGEMESLSNYSDINEPFGPARRVLNGENERFIANQVPSAVESTRYELANNVPNEAPGYRAQGFNVRSPRQSPHPPANHVEFMNDTPNEALGIQTESFNVSLPAPSPHPAPNQLEFPNYMMNEAVGIQAQGFNNGPQMQSPPSPTTHLGLANDIPNETLGVQNEDLDVSLPIKGSGLRRSSRKRNEAIYNEDLLANRLPRLTRWKGKGSKKKTSTRALRIRASNHYPPLPISDSKDYESDD